MFHKIIEYQIMLHKNNI